MVANTYSVKEIFQAASILVRDEDFDVFNSLDVMDNKECFEELDFSPGDGYLHYYLYNYTLKSFCILPQQVGLVLV